jgi:hypothetical protein
MAGPWDLDGYRDLFGFDRTVTDHAVRVYAFGSQASDGSDERELPLSEVRQHGRGHRADSVSTRVRW